MQTYANKMYFYNKGRNENAFNKGKMMIDRLADRSTGYQLTGLSVSRKPAYACNIALMIRR